jgi:AcrR family transcriptional regulator
MDATVPADGEETRARIVRAARELVVEHGYDGVSTAEVLRRAEVSRGGLYHHFAGKAELLVAVLEDLEVEVLAEIADVLMAAPDAMTGLEIAMDWYLDECMRSTELQRIGLIEGRNALGWEAWRKVVAPHGLGLLSLALRTAMEEGTVRPLDADALGLLLLAALHEACAVILSADDRDRERERTGEALKALLEGVRVAGPQA